ncbi:MAG: hypothetical protein LBJ14_05415 [Desulfarculales bacterium]|jgi:hypothetical protein|nr:hypothetical protein [Desulfarculales bacterium]
MSTKSRSFILSGLLFVLSGCAVYHGGSFVSADLPPNKSQLMVEKVVERLVAVYPPGRTALCLDLIKSDFFGRELESKLRTQGFKLLPSQHGQNALLLTYTVDSLEDDKEALLWYVRIRLSDGFSFAQVYDLGDTPKALGGMTQIIPAGD